MLFPHAHTLAHDLLTRCPEGEDRIVSSLQQMALTVDGPRRPQHKVSVSSGA